MFTDSLRLSRSADFAVLLGVATITTARAAGLHRLAVTQGTGSNVGVSTTGYVAAGESLSNTQPSNRP